MEYKLTIFDVANYFLNRKLMSNKKIQKMCYYAYSWYLNLVDEELFENKFEAWKHGPVDPRLYKKYNSFGYKNITTYEDIDLCPEIEQFLDLVYEEYGQMTASELEELSHVENPWKEARGNLLSFQSSKKPITKELIQNYYIQEYGNIFENNRILREKVAGLWEN